MKTALVLISLSSLYLINAAPIKRTRGSRTSTPPPTTEAGFIAKYFHLPEFLKFSSQNKYTTEQPINTVELPQRSRLGKIFDSINVFKKSKPSDEPYLRAYIQPNGTYKWYFVYPGQMLYPAPDQFSLDALQKTTPPTTTPTTTTTTTTARPSEDDTPKPLYPLMGKIEFVKNETEPKENEWAITISDSGPIFQPFGEIRPPFDEPLLQQFHQDDDDQPPQDEEPEEENESVTRRKRKQSRTEKPVEEEESPEQQADEEPADEQQENTPEDAAEYDNAEGEGEPEQNDNEASADENTQDDVPEEDEQAADDEDQAADDDEDATTEEAPVTKAKKRQ
ncbi:transcription initiation factor TFIID subunit 11-like [Planococcus citri]|uniref:transcription initiation factor TFIID subunit 11-like n=1 Tax=Planococcus citri TaxID=170843 RepID=UPI0031FA367F